MAPSLPGAPKLVPAALSTLRQWIDHIGDSFEFGGELPRVVRRKHRVRAVEIDMHQVIKTQDRPSDDKGDAMIGGVVLRSGNQTGEKGRE